MPQLHRATTPAATHDASDLDRPDTSAVAHRLRSAVRYLSAHWPDLLDPALAAGEGGTTVAGSRVPLLTEALHLRVQVPAVLAGWCDYASRALAVCPARALDAGDVPALAHWLAPHADALADDPTATAAVDELDQLVAEVARVVAPDGARTIALPALMPATATGPASADALAEAASARGAACPYPQCPGALAMTAAPGETTAITCSAHSGHRWEQREWVVLARRLGDEAPARMSSGQLAEWLSTHLSTRVPRRTLLTWATRYPQDVRRGADGLFDRVAVAQWYLQHRARTASPA